MVAFEDHLIPIPVGREGIQPEGEAPVAQRIHLDPDADLTFMVGKACVYPVVRIQTGRFAQDQGAAGGRLRCAGGQGQQREEE